MAPPSDTKDDDLAAALAAANGDDAAPAPAPASDPDADPLTYCWEEFDLGPQGPPDAPSGNAPIFRSFNPTESPWRVFPRMSDILSGSHTIGELLPTYARDLRFRLTARDNRILGGGNAWDGIDLTVTDQAGPFRVTGLDTPAIWLGNTIETITWDAARTNQSPVSCQQVDIVLSDDFAEFLTLRAYSLLG